MVFVWVLGGGGGDEHEAAVLARAEGGVEGAGSELQGADQKVVEELVVGEIEALDRLAAAIAADQVEEAIDAAEAVGEGGGPVVGGALVEEVDGAGVDALLGQPERVLHRIGVLLGSIGEGEGGAGVSEALRHHRAETAAGPGDRDHPSV